MSVAVLVGLLASLLSLYAPVPQILRVVRSKSAQGVSWSSLVLSLATFTMWVVYAFVVADLIQMISNTVALILLVVFAVVVFRAGVARSYWPAVVAMLGTAGVAIVLVDRTNSFTLAMVGTLASSLRLVPQARLALSGAPLWGLCPWSTLLGWWGMGAWLGYAVLVSDPGLGICSGVALVLQTAIVVHRLPLRRTLASLAGGRLGAPVATLVAPTAARLPYPGKYRLAA